jgi:hypothetical protein
MPTNIMCHKRDILYVYGYNMTHYVKLLLYYYREKVKL